MCWNNESDWIGIDQANALGPFCPLADLQAVLERYPGTDCPEYQYFVGLLMGRDPDYHPPEGVTVVDHINVLNFINKTMDDPFLAEITAGYRDGILVQIGFFD